MMFEIIFKTKWADFDPNRHMRHTAYSDYAAEVRSRFFYQHDLSLEDFARIQIGPVIFKEETTYYKEIKMGADIRVDMLLTAASEKLERWEFTHRIFNTNDELSAVVKVNGAWFDLQSRKLTRLPDEIIEKLKNLPKSDNFKNIELKK
jgi:acyl-CoA thioester hydrolase